MTSMTPSLPEPTNPSTSRKTSRNLRPKLSIERESPKVKVTLELRESTDSLLQSYARFLSGHMGFEVSTSVAAENIIKAFVGEDELFLESQKESSKKEKAGATAKATKAGGA